MDDDAHIVVVDDEVDVRETVTDYLVSRGLRVTALENAAQLRELLGKSKVDVALLDLRMPGEDGLSLARHVRETCDAGIIMVTAIAEPADRVLGLELGADDYVAKPFDLRELLARVRSVLRRRAAASEPAAPDTKSKERIRFGDFVIDMVARRLRRLDGTDIPLTAMEFDLLSLFATRPGRVLSRDQILDLAHNKDEEPLDRSIDIRVTRLRRKIEVDPARPAHIKTVRGVGYVFELKASPD
ncbi:MAG TPA: response regulator [Geminicoccus sp.]|jgi:two-component system phosphate regulon response regulator OmpR|uniref:response regulator n=1 Tax=Geminicoccus sp. TaxID=2024832 RepID=UPI002E36D828|nr:response regulator [Geminicoccus sp.]HEX2529557.1 response regulator [Geminicoccus sp.]